ncbi:MAG: hypothetical protein V1806_09420 [Pseudomonadota bacterium]
MSHPKMLGQLLALGLLLALVDPGYSWAAPAPGGAGAGQMSDEASPTVEIIVGELEKTPRGLVLRAQDGDFRLKGLDMSKDLGRQVEVTGVIGEEDQPLPLIRVQRYKVLR